jgi:hypothetical protein
MLNAGVLRFASNGRIRNTTAAPTDFNGGTPTVQGLLSYSITLPDTFVGGIGYRVNGAICVAVGGAPTHYVAGLPVNALGQLCVTQSLIQPVSWVAGLPIGLDGLLALAPAESPAVVDAFSSAFSGAFG